MYYLLGGYIFNCGIAITVWRPVSVLPSRRLAITETGCDTGYFGKSRVAACFSITCQTVSSSIRYLAVYTILAM